MKDVKLKKCNKCGRELPFTEEFFPKNKRAKDGLEKTCKKCKNDKKKERSFPIIYEIKCIHTNMYYIGQTIKPLNDRISKHFSDAKRGRKQPLYDDIRKLGYNKKLFSYKELERLDDKELLDERERYWINEYNNKGLLLYNRELGGKKNFDVINDTKEKMAKSKGTRPFIIYDFINKKFIGEFNSITTASKILDVSNSVVSNHLKNNTSHVKNFIIIYKEEYSEEYLKNILEELSSKIKIYDDGKIRKIDKYKGENNAMYGKIGGLNPNSKKIYIVNYYGDIVENFDCLKDAKQKYGYQILEYIKGQNNHYYKRFNFYTYDEYNLPFCIREQGKVVSYED